MPFFLKYLIHIQIHSEKANHLKYLIHIQIHSEKANHLKYLIHIQIHSEKANHLKYLIHIQIHSEKANHLKYLIHIQIHSEKANHLKYLIHIQIHSEKANHAPRISSRSTVVKLTFTLYILMEFPCARISLSTLWGGGIRLKSLGLCYMHNIVSLCQLLIPTVKCRWIRSVCCSLDTSDLQLHFLQWQSV